MSTEIKPGYKTTEFWLHMVAAGLIAALTAFDPVKAGAPPLVQGIWQIVAPLALAWLAKSYGDSRAEVKMAAQGASDGVKGEGDAAAVLRK